MGDPAYIAQTLLWSVCCVYAVVVGYGYSRLAGAALFIQMLSELVAYQIGSDLGVKLSTGLTDVVILMIFVRALYAERRTWMAAAAGGQLMSLAIQVSRLLEPQFHKWASVTATELFGFWVLACVTYGAWNSRARC